MIPMCLSQPARNQSHLRLRRVDTAMGLLLKAMQHINGSLESNRVNRSINIPGVVLNYFRHARAFSLPRFGRRMFSTKLSDTERNADAILHSLGKSQQIPFGGSHPI